jgi:hypothetical protein
VVQRPALGAALHGGHAAPGGVVLHAEAEVVRGEGGGRRQVLLPGQVRPLRVQRAKDPVQHLRGGAWGLWGRALWGRALWGRALWGVVGCVGVAGCSVCARLVRGWGRRSARPPPARLDPPPPARPPPNAPRAAHLRLHGGPAARRRRQEALAPGHALALRQRALLPQLLDARHQRFQVGRKGLGRGLGHVEHHLRGGGGGGGGGARAVGVCV